VIDYVDEFAIALVPPTYFAQVHAQLEATGLPWCDIVAFFGPHDVRVIRIMRAHERYGRRMVERVAAWRERYLVRGEQPDYDGSQESRTFITSNRKGVREADSWEASVVRAYSIHCKAREKSDEDRRLLIADLGKRLAKDRTKTLLIKQPGYRDARATLSRGALRITGLLE